MTEWNLTEVNIPKEGDKIKAKLIGCKYTDYIYMEVLEGEGLGHIKEWRYATEEEKKAFDE